MKFVGKRAVIVGGSLAGMSAAKVLADYVDEVLVLDRDEFPETPAPRRTTPQSGHVHMLLKGGERAITELVPGFLESIERSGSVQMQAGVDFIAGSELGFAPRQPLEMTLHGQSRWMLEHCLRTCVVKSAPNVRIRSGVSVTGLIYNRDQNRVTGVQLKDESIDADVVVDAAGRAGAGIRWLTELGLETPEVEEVEVDFGYASVVLRLDPAQERDWKAVVIGNRPRVGARGGVLLPIEGDRHMCSLGGRAGDYPPGDRDGFLEFAKSLPQPLLYETMSRAEFLSPIATMVYPANRFRHYERMENLPEGLIPVGDALCSFNPTYGQGMSSAGMQAFELHEAFQDHRDNGATLREVTMDYLHRAAKIANRPWRQANYNDFLYPTTKGDRSMFTEDEMRYRSIVQRVAIVDDVVREAANDVNHLLAPYERLLEPEILQRVEEVAKNLPKPEAAKESGDD